MPQNTGVRTVNFPTTEFLYNAGFYPEWDFFSPFLYPSEFMAPEDTGEGGDDSMVRDAQGLLDARRTLRNEGGRSPESRRAGSFDVRSLPSIGLGELAGIKASPQLTAMVDPYMAMALAPIASLGSLAGGSFALAGGLGQHYGIVPTINSPVDFGHRPQVGTPGFDATVEAGRRAKELSAQVESLGALAAAVDKARSGGGDKGPSRGGGDNSVGGLHGGASGHPGFGGDRDREGGGFGPR